MSERRTRLAVFGIAAILLAARPAAQSAPPPDTSVKGLVAAGSKYVSEYAGKMKFVLGEETYLQEVFASKDVRTSSRRMKGDIYLQYLPADRDWIAVHDVMEVDGAPITDRLELQALLRLGEDESVLRKIVQRNARYNIGQIERTFNEPTLALLVLDPQRVANFKFSRGAIQTIGGATVATLSFEEKDGPTIVRTQSGSAVRSKGEILLEAGTGRVRQTRIAFSYGKIQAELSTVYVPDAKLDLWVPQTFTEHYEGEPDGLKEIITCNARYSNYQKFGVTGRIIKKTDHR